MRNGPTLPGSEPIRDPHKQCRQDGRRLQWHIEPLTADLTGPGGRCLARRGDQTVWAVGGPGLWEFRAFLTPTDPDHGGSPCWKIVGDEETRMPRIAKANALLQAEQVTQEIEAPGPGGIPITISRPGEWVTYLETQDGELVFKGFLTDSEYREKFVRVSGGLEAARR